MIEGPSGQRTLTRGVFGRGKGHEPASDPSCRAPHAAGRAFLRLVRRATSAVVSPKTVVSGGRGACDREPVRLPSVAIECDPRARPRIQGTPRRRSEVTLVTQRGWSRLFWRRLQPGCCEIRGRIGFWGQSDAAPSRLLVMRSGASPIRLTRTPSVAGSWESRVENPVPPVKIARSAPDLVARVE